MFQYGIMSLKEILCRLRSENLALNIVCLTTKCGKSATLPYQKPLYCEPCWFTQRFCRLCGCYRDRDVCQYDEQHVQNVRCACGLPRTHPTQLPVQCIRCFTFKTIYSIAPTFAVTVPFHRCELCGRGAWVEEDAKECIACRLREVGILLLLGVPTFYIQIVQCIQDFIY